MTIIEEIHKKYGGLCWALMSAHGRMTITEEIHKKYGGCAAYRATRVGGGMRYGAWAASDPSVWEETCSGSMAELWLRLRGTAPRQIAFKPDEPWTVSYDQRKRAVAAVEARRRAARRVAP